MILEINLENPISEGEVIRLKSELIKSKEHDFLIIDTGAYDFESVRAIDFFRRQLVDLGPCLTKFKKIALITPPPPYNNNRNTPESYDHFFSKIQAVKWFTE